MKKILLLILLFGFKLINAQNLQREHFNRNSFWLENVFNGKLKGKWRYQFDYQYRRMSDASFVTNSNTNMFKNASQNVFRPWLHYQMNDKIRLSISPIGFWETWSPAVENSGTAKIQPEFRICPQITYTTNAGKVIVDQRYRYEYRILGTKVANNMDVIDYSQGMDFPASGRKNRFRYFVRATIPLGKHKKLEPNTFYLTTWNELFMGFGKNTNNDKIWDQNRTFLLLGYKPNSTVPVRFELGYGLQAANRFSSTFANNVLTETDRKIEKNNILQAYIIFENVNELFKHKK